MTIREYRRVSDIAEALELLAASPDNAVVAGLTALKMGKRDIGTAVDLSGLGLDRIEEDGKVLRIGAYAPLRAVELSEACRRARGGALAEAASRVGGVQLRWHATAGGSAASRWGVSLFNAALLAAGAKAVLAKAGEIDFADFLARGAPADLLLSLNVPLSGPPVALASERISALDFPLLNVAAAAGSGAEARIAVGARPGGPVLSPAAAAAWKRGEGPVAAAVAAAAEIPFADDIRASAWYRKELCAVLAERALAGGGA